MNPDEYSEAVIRARLEEIRASNRKQLYFRTRSPRNMSIHIEDRLEELEDKVDFFDERVWDNIRDKVSESESEIADLKSELRDLERRFESLDDYVDGIVSCDCERDHTISRVEYEPTLTPTTDNNTDLENRVSRLEAYITNELTLLRMRIEEIEANSKKRRGFFG